MSGEVGTGSPPGHALKNAVILYGAPAPGLVEVPRGARQVSPLIPGAEDIAAIPDASLDAAVILAPPGSVERDHVLAQALRALKPGGELTAFAPKDKGGSRLKKTIQAFGCTVGEDARRHHRFCMTARPEAVTGVTEAIAAGAPRLSPQLGRWTQPGVFSWDRIDAGSAVLLSALPPVQGRGADLGCGIGLLASQLLAQPAVTELFCIDIDRRAVDCAQRNLDDPRVRLSWADVRLWADRPADLDFVVMNPPFHDGGREDRDLGVAFCQSAAAMLRKGGTCWLVANRHLPYEAPLAAAFSKVQVLKEAEGFKVFEARK